MKKVSTISNQPLIPLSNKEQSQIKGGIILYCEEKRIKVLGREVIIPEFRTEDDGSPYLTTRM